LSGSEGLLTESATVRNQSVTPETRGIPPTARRLSFICSGGVYGMAHLRINAVVHGSFPPSSVLSSRGDPAYRASVRGWNREFSASCPRSRMTVAYAFRVGRAGARSTITTPAIATSAPGTAARAGHSLSSNPANTAANSGVIRPRLVVNTEGSLADAMP